MCKSWACARNCLCNSMLSSPQANFKWPVWALQIFAIYVKTKKNMHKNEEKDKSWFIIDNINTKFSNNMLNLFKLLKCVYQPTIKPYELIIFKNVCSCFWAYWCGLRLKGLFLLQPVVWKRQLIQAYSLLQLLSLV